MKFPFALLLAAIVLVPLSATVADDAVGKKACALVQDAYDACPDGICKAAVVTLNRDAPGCPVKLDPVSRAAPGSSPFDKPISALAITKMPIVENLKVALAKLKSGGESGNSTAAPEPPNPERTTRQPAADGGTVSDPFAADTAPTNADLGQFYALEKQRKDREEQEHREREWQREQERQQAQQQQARREEEQRATRAQEQSRQRQDAWTSAIDILETLVEIKEIKERRQQE